MVTQHRELWSEAHRRPELARLFQTEVDLVGAPITVAEEEYLNLVIDYFHTGWQYCSAWGVVERAGWRAG